VCVCLCCFCALFWLGRVCMCWCNSLTDFDSSLCEVDRNCTLGFWEKGQVFKGWMSAFVFRPQASAALYSESYYEIRRESTWYGVFFCFLLKFSLVSTSRNLCPCVNCFFPSLPSLSCFILSFSGGFSVVTELFTQIESHILTRVIRMCICLTQGARDTFENYYRKQRRKQARLVLQPHSNMVRPYTAWEHVVSNCLSDTLL